MTSSSPTGMSIQFRTLIFYSRPEKQLQECLHLKKYVTSLPAAIEALGSPLGPHPKSDLDIDLYSGSTLIAIKMSLIIASVSDDFKKATISIQEAIKA
jgi:hypothetical protein